MSVSLSQQNSCSSSTMSRWMQQRTSFGSQRRTPSVYGGAGGFGTRVSQGSSSFSSSVFCSSGSLTNGSEITLINEGKTTMQNLNDRSASYSEKVRCSEEKNRESQSNIDEFCVKTRYITKDYKSYFTTIADSKAEIAKTFSENQRIILQIDNSKSAAEDFKVKYEMEMKMTRTVEADVSRLREIRDSSTLTISTSEMSVEESKEELIHMAQSHKEDIEKSRLQGSGKVNVQVDSADSTDSAKVSEEMRERYETVMKNNKSEVEEWFNSKMKILQEQIITCTTEVKTYHAEVSESRRTYQSSEISRESLCTEIQYSQQSVCEVKDQYSVQLSRYQSIITSSETESQNLNACSKQSPIKYSMSKDLKYKSESEIEEYRRSSEGEAFEQKRALIIKQVTEEVEDQKPHIEKRVRTIVEEIVDGKVVSSSVDTQVHTIQ